MVHLADKHLAPTGYIKFLATRGSLHGSKQSSPLELVAKGTVMQMGLNLSVDKLREDIVYENANINFFICDRLKQERNEAYLPGAANIKERQSWISMEHAAHMFKYFGAGDNRPPNGTYYELRNEGRKGSYVTP